MGKLFSGIGKFIGSIFGGGGSQPYLPPPAPEPPPPAVETKPPAETKPDPTEVAQKEYERRLGELKTQRTKDVSSMKSRLAAGGVAAESPGWMQGLETIYSSYEDKLKQLGSDPYFEKVKKSTSPWI